MTCDAVAELQREAEDPSLCHQWFDPDTLHYNAMKAHDLKTGGYVGRKLMITLKLFTLKAPLGEKRNMTEASWSCMVAEYWWRSNERHSLKVVTTASSTREHHAAICG
jgi:hypothetical protein